MWDLLKWYISSCSNSVQYVRLHPTLMSILLYHYKQLTGCIEEVERIEAKVNDKKKVWLIKKKEGEEKQQEKEEAPSKIVALLRIKLLKVNNNSKNN
jgi:hypothetical protein